jgi:hypothetical protein
MLEPDQWDAVLSRITSTIYRSSNEIHDACENARLVENGFEFGASSQ